MYIYIYINTYIHTYIIHTCTHDSKQSGRRDRNPAGGSERLEVRPHGREEGRVPVPWWRTNGVNTDGAAAKAMTFDRLGKKVRTPWHFREGKSRSTGVPKNPSVKQTQNLQ